MIIDLIFYMFATGMVIGACTAVFIHNSIYSLLSLIFVFFNAAGIFLLSGAEFLAMILIIVYIGAVAVLFVFVVMMVDFNQPNKLFNKKWLGIISILIFTEVFLLFYQQHQEINERANLQYQGDNISDLGAVLYNKYFYIFQLSGILLLVAMIGAIVLTLYPNNRLRRRTQSAQQQIARDPKLSITMVQLDSTRMDKQ
jgi:NADH-quinone oxidoreductase subunit J